MLLWLSVIQVCFPCQAFDEGRLRNGNQRDCISKLGAAWAEMSASSCPTVYTDSGNEEVLVRASSDHQRVCGLAQRYAEAAG